MSISSAAKLCYSKGLDAAERIVSVALKSPIIIMKLSLTPILAVAGMSLLAPSLQGETVGAWNPDQDNSAVKRNLLFRGVNSGNLEEPSLAGRGDNTGSSLSYQELGVVAKPGDYNFSDKNSTITVGASLCTTGDGNLKPTRMRLHDSDIDILQIQANDESGAGVGMFAGVYALSLEANTPIGAISQVLHHSKNAFEDVSTGNQSARYWIELDDGTQFVSEMIPLAAGDNALTFDVSALRWWQWSAANFESSNGARRGDFTWSQTIGSEASIDASRVVRKLGFTWQDSEARGYSSWGVQMTRVEASKSQVTSIPELSNTALVLGFCSMLLLSLRRRV